MPQVSALGKSALLAVATLLTGSAALAQAFDGLPEAQQVGYCATYYYAVAETDGGSDQAMALAAGFTDVAAGLSGREAEDLKADLLLGVPMLAPSIETVDTDAGAKAMIDASIAFCTNLAADYAQTKDLAE